MAIIKLNNMLFNKSLNFFNKKNIFIFLFILLFNISYTSNNQNIKKDYVDDVVENTNNHNFRRHFIIAYDVSTPFKSAVKDNYYYKRSLINLFQNKNNIYGDEANITNLLNERSNNLKFFDPEKDEISFFHFNIAQEEFNNLQSYNARSDNNAKVSTFCNSFLKYKNFSWSSYKQTYNNSIDNYINKLFSIKPSPEYFGNGVSISNFVYPLILSKIDTSKYAEEYILIILSDFLTGSMHGNKMDYNRIKDVYKYPYNTDLPKNSAPSLIKSFTDELASFFYKIDYFEITFNNTLNKKPISIISYKIKPKAGNYSPEDVSMFIDSDIKLIQKSYKSSKFNIPKSFLRFTHNSNIKPQKVYLKISIPDGNNQLILFDDIIAFKDNNNKWRSTFTLSEDLMDFNESKSLYCIPSLKIELDTIINSYKRKDFDFVKFEYKVNSTYKTNSNPINFIYKTERNIDKNNVIFATKTTIIIMYYVIPIILLIIIILILIALGKPRAIKYVIHGYLDSYEEVNYREHGKLLTPYKTWDTTLDNIVIVGEVLYKYKKYLFNWKPKLNFQIIKEDIPKEFDLFLKLNNSEFQEFSKNYKMSVKTDKNHKFKFIVCLRQNDINFTINDPILIQYKIKGKINQSKLSIIKANISEIIEYKFQIGKDLGDLWVAFDPGTTGSCVAVGNQGDNIQMCKDMGGNQIIPSKLVFFENKEYNGNLNSDLYWYGTRAAQRFTGPNCFQSFKKLLGFKDKKQIEFKNKSISLSGKELSALLLKGLYQDLNDYVEESNINFFNTNKSFNPKRAVVAIPNNFTISKVQDIVDSLKSLNKFDEVRYVYEAEAVLFYYLSNYSRFNKDKKTIANENILIFDMGGATINATVVNVSKQNEGNKDFYDIDILGKIGYGIGGDSIDYCLCKFILAFNNEYPTLNAFKINDKKDKSKLSNMAKRIKEEISYNYINDYNYLITYADLERIINDELEINLNNLEPITIDEYSDIYRYFLKDDNGIFPLLQESYFDLVFDNIKDSIQEVLDVSKVDSIDKVIFSGRSTFFPYVKETVKSQLIANNISSNFINFRIDESKTVVANGACWYGINKNTIRLHNVKTNASFGVKQTLSPDKTDIKFIEFIKIGQQFNKDNGEFNKINVNKNIASEFSFDGNQVNFYQVMGKDAKNIISNNLKHKFSKITSIQIPQPTNSIAMEVKEDDDILCAVTLISERELKARGVVSDQEINDANEEHYTWMVK